MRSEHLIIILCLLLIWKLATRITGAAHTTPPDDEPHTEQPPLPFAETAHVDHIGEFIQRANAS